MFSRSVVFIAFVGSLIVRVAWLHRCGVCDCLFGCVGMVLGCFLVLGMGFYVLIVLLVVVLWVASFSSVF